FSKLTNVNEHRRPMGVGTFHDNQGSRSVLAFLPIARHRNSKGVGDVGSLSLDLVGSIVDHPTTYDRDIGVARDTRDKLFNRIQRDEAVGRNEYDQLGFG